MSEEAGCAGSAAQMEVVNPSPREPRRGCRLEGGGEQVAGGQAPVRPPFLGDGQHLVLVVEPVRGLDRLAQRQVTRQYDVLPLERDEHGALHRPGPDARDRGQLGQELVVGQAAQGVRVQLAVGQPLGQVAERADLPPREPRLAEPGGIEGQQLGGCGQAATEQRLDPPQDRAGRRDGQLLPGHLEHQGPVQVHGRQLRHPGLGIEVRPLVDQPRQHRVGVQPRRNPWLPQPDGKSGL